MSTDIESKFGYYPSIFKSESKNLLVILGGELMTEDRITVSIVLEDSKTAEQELKIRKHKTGFRHRGLIHNNSIHVDEEEGISTFMSYMGSSHPIVPSKIKLHD
jgi:hypothetical protein